MRANLKIKHERMDNMFMDTMKEAFAACAILFGLPVVLAVITVAIFALADCKKRRGRK